MSRTSVFDNQTLVNAIQGGPTGAVVVSQGSQTVTTSGTPVQLSVSSVFCKRVWIQAYAANTGIVSIGGASVSGNPASPSGTWLYPTQGSWFLVSNLNLLYIDAETSGNKISFYYEN